MGAGAIVLSALTAVGSWVLNNPNIALEAVDKVTKLPLNKKAKDQEEHLQIIDEKLNQVGAAALELEEKINAEVDSLHKQLRTMKIMLSVMGAVLGVAVIAIILLAIF